MCAQDRSQLHTHSLVPVQLSIQLLDLLPKELSQRCDVALQLLLHQFQPRLDQIQARDPRLREIQALPEIRDLGDKGC